jgi:protein phosphatase
MNTQDKPQFSDVDAWGLSHPGKVRGENQDHFFLGALAQGVTVDNTSIDAEGRNVLHVERLASLAIVADGVGGAGGGETAARRAVQDLLSSVSKFFYEAEFQESEDPEVFSRLLNEAALAEHETLLGQAEEEGGERRFATTVTLFLGLWPHAYLLQVGDSRCYLFKDDVLTQITRDQTLAQELVDSKVLPQTVADRSRWAHVLSSAIGGEAAVPIVTRVTRDWGSVLLLCSDGLTKHVSDERIKERLANMSSSRGVAEQLLQDALDDGGTDNITIIVGRTLPPEEHEQDEG